MESQIEANKELVRFWLEEGWNKNRNQEIVDQVFSNDWDSASASMEVHKNGPEGMMQSVNSFRKIFTDVHFNITHLIADKDFVTVRFEVTATQIGEFIGIKATHKTINYTGIVIHQISNGKISKTWTEFDLFAMIAQIEK